jgi:molybdopterin molybdotransferase
MAHLPHELRKITAPLATRVKPAIGRDLLLTVRLENGLVVSTFKESGAITSIARADGYILVPHTIEFLEKGTLVDMILF